MSNAASIMQHMWETLCWCRPGRSVSWWQMKEYSQTWDMVDRGLIWLAIFNIVQKVETLWSPRAQMAVFNGSVNSTNEILLIWTCIFLHQSELECFTETYIYTSKVIDDRLSGSRIFFFFLNQFGQLNSESKQAPSWVGNRRLLWDTPNWAYQNRLQSRTCCGAVANWMKRLMKLHVRELPVSLSDQNERTKVRYGVSRSKRQWIHTGCNLSLNYALHWEHIYWPNCCPKISALCQTCCTIQKTRGQVLPWHLAYLGALKEITMKSMTHNDEQFQVILGTWKDSV